MYTYSVCQFGSMGPGSWVLGPWPRSQVLGSTEYSIPFLASWICQFITGQGVDSLHGVLSVVPDKGWNLVFIGGVLDSCVMY